MIEFNDIVCKSNDNIFVAQFPKNIISTNMYIKYNKKDEDAIILKIKLKFKNTMYYLCDDRGEIIQWPLDSSCAKVITRITIPTSDELFIEAEYVKDGRTIKTFGDLKIYSKR